MEPLPKKMGISSAEVISNIIDLVLPILLSLPPRSLIRFKCICKQWLSLISDTQFQYDHTLRNPHLSTTGLYTTRYSKLLETCLPISLLGGSQCSLPPLSFMKQSGTFICVNHSLNGLLLCSAFTSTTCMPQFLICNPTTQRYKLLPLLDGLSWGQDVQCFLYFDPSISTHFKVILFNHSSSRNVYEFAIYSSESESWKTISHIDITNVSFTYGLLSSGAVIHLMGYSYNHLILVRFKVDTEKFLSSRWIGYPRTSHPYKIRYFGEHGGKLLLIVCCDGRELRSYEMDEKEGRNRHWIMKLHLDLVQVFSLPSADQPYLYEGQVYCGISVLWATYQGGDLELVLAVHDKVISYNHRTKVKKFLDLPPHNRNSFWCKNETIKVHPFIESLFPV